ncbi:hypothetical protein DRH14_03865 [Candidatus Shapirobacteria bacterium]|nr:MAG: hypothetical protein DRH14_03865 [Candidatus Shapirobacteria bacterium]
MSIGNGRSRMERVEEKLERWLKKVKQYFPAEWEAEAAKWYPHFIPPWIEFPAGAHYHAKMIVESFRAKDLPFSEKIHRILYYLIGFITYAFLAHKAQEMETRKHVMPYYIDAITSEVTHILFPWIISEIEKLEKRR